MTKLLFLLSLAAIPAFAKGHSHSHSHSAHHSHKATHTTSHTKTCNSQDPKHRSACDKQKTQKP